MSVLPALTFNHSAIKAGSIDVHAPHYAFFNQYFTCGYNISIHGFQNTAISYNFAYAMGKYCTYYLQYFPIQVNHSLVTQLCLIRGDSRSSDNPTLQAEDVEPVPA